MYRRLAFLLVLTLALVGAVPALAQGQGPSPQHSQAAWDASYWNNMSLSGDPVVTAADAHLDWDWGTGSPHASVPADHFSARWSRVVDFAAARYRFTAVSDDGVRLYVDDQLLINQWNDHPAQAFTAEIELTAGHHLVKVEYYENGGLAEISLSWAPTTVNVQNWRGEYFNNPTLSGAPTLVRDDRHISFDWRSGPPANGLPADRFSVRWSRSVSFEPGTYRFTTRSDDGVRLWVNGHLLVDDWNDHPATNSHGTMYLSGLVPIKLEYYENGGLAFAQLSWVRQDGTTPPSSGGAIVVDDSDAGFVRGGSPTGWRAAGEGYGGQLTWTRNNDYARANYNWARWYPTLTAGRYEVFAYVPQRYSTTSNARYWISHRDGYTVRVVDQSAQGGHWVSLGTYWFRGTYADYVSLADATFEPYLSRLIAFDAIKWEAR